MDIIIVLYYGYYEWERHAVIAKNFPPPPPPPPNPLQIP